MECREQTAVDWIVAPEEPASPGACMMHGMLYAASSNLVREGSYAKVFCQPHGTVRHSFATGKLPTVE
jgi:hypothetical protein